MPYIRDGKCVYKKNKDGSRGEKEGCSDSIEKAKDYLKALYANTDDAPKKENKSMKMKKSELLALIKEEIMDEMRGLTMMDDPYDDDAVPAGMEQGGAMDQVAKEIDHMITIQMDDIVAMLSNYLVTSGASRDPRRAAAMGMEMLRDAGLTFPDQSALERMIAGDDGGMMEEGMENITPENIGIVFEALGKMAPMIGAMGVPAFIVMLKEFYDERKGAQDGGEM